MFVVHYEMAARADFTIVTRFLTRLNFTEALYNHSKLPYVHPFAKRVIRSVVQEPRCPLFI